MELYCMSYVYADRRTAHLCSLTAAREGIAFLGLRMVVSGLWSVIRVNLLPYKYW